ncbi:MAG TPA: hypothetical protein VFC54_14815 [Pseudolabrys sp.]|nr:hypothetical protein [Pseudolabrys sp.]
MRPIALCAAALLLAGCAETTSTQGIGGLSASASPRPKTIVVSDFTVSSDLVVIDRGYTARVERKIGQYPTFERKQRTLERVNDEIVATIIATLREAGLDAQPGAEEGVSLTDRVLIVSGRLVPAGSSAKKNEAGIGGGKSGAAAEIALSSLSSFGKKKLIGFDVSPTGGKKGPGGKTAAALNASIAAAVGDKAAVKLSPDVETVARAIGRAAGDKIVAYASEQGWLAHPGEGGAEETKPDAKPDAASDKVKLPAPHPAKKPEA